MWYVITVLYGITIFHRASFGAYTREREKVHVSNYVLTESGTFILASTFRCRSFCLFVARLTTVSIAHSGCPHRERKTTKLTPVQWRSVGEGGDANLRETQEPGSGRVPGEWRVDWNTEWRPEAVDENPHLPLQMILDRPELCMRCHAATTVFDQSSRLVPLNCPPQITFSS